MLKKIKEKLTHVVTKVKNFFNGVVSNIKNGKGKTLYNKVVRFFGARRAKIINPRENNVRNIGSQNININEQQRPLGLYKPPIRTNNNPKREKVGSNSNVTKNGKKERDNNKKIFKAKPRIVPNVSKSKSNMAKERTENEKNILNKMLDSFNEKKLQSEDDLRKQIAEIFYLEVDQISDDLNLSKSGNLKNGSNIRDVKLCFFSDRSSRNLGEFQQINDEANISINEGLLYGGLRSDKPEERKKACEKIFRVLYHEISHYKDEIEKDQCADIGSEDRMLATGDRNIVNYEKFKYTGNDKKRNYPNMYIEAKANEYAYERLMDVFGYNKEFDVMKKLYATQKILGRYNYLDKTEPREEVIQDVLDHGICEADRYKTLNTKIKKYGGEILKKEYNFEENRRLTPNEIVSSMESDIKNIEQNSNITQEEKNEQIEKIQDMYYGILYREFKVAKEEAINEFVDKQGEDKAKQLYSGIYQHYENKRQIELSAIDEREKLIEEARQNKIFIPKEFYNSRGETEYRKNLTNQYYDGVLNKIVELNEGEQIKQNNNQTSNKSREQSNTLNNEISNESLPNEASQEACSSYVNDIVEVAKENEKLQEQVENAKEILREVKEENQEVQSR